MASALNWNGKLIDHDGHEHLQVQIIVRGNVATIRRAGTVILERATVRSVEATLTNRRVIEFTDGSSWVADRKKGCGCR